MHDSRQGIKLHASLHCDSNFANQLTSRGRDYGRTENFIILGLVDNLDEAIRCPLAHGTIDVSDFLKSNAHLVRTVTKFLPRFRLRETYRRYLWTGKCCTWNIARQHSRIGKRQESIARSDCPLISSIMRKLLIASAITCSIHALYARPQLIVHGNSTRLGIQFNANLLQIHSMYDRLAAHSQEQQFAFNIIIVNINNVVPTFFSRSNSNIFHANTALDNAYALLRKNLLQCRAYLGFISWQ
mmetsp:Transcript_21555/g.32181  ORF Transcript_21555/g.32181 Transcript_21555/m.32181 type:complete len:242 (-) Transcript_21555:298-1023(-)